MAVGLQKLSFQHLGRGLEKLTLRSLGLENRHPETSLRRGGGGVGQDFQHNNPWRSLELQSNPKRARNTTRRYVATREIPYVYTPSHNPWRSPEPTA